MKILKTLLISALVNFSFSCLAAPELIFLNAKQSEEELGKNDAFMQRLSQFDMAARMKTEEHINKQDFRKFVQSNTLDWTEQDKTVVNEVYSNLKKELSKYPLSLPTKFNMILTTGNEEGTAAYTRNNAIILQRNKLKIGVGLKRLMAHEIFHIYSRLNTEKKDELYQSIGFKYVGEIEFPDNLKHRKITNPDVPVNEYAIKVNLNDESVWAMPILYSSSEKYDLKKGGEFFNYLQFKLLVLEYQNGKWAYDKDTPTIVDLSTITGFFEQVGTNTKYIIHPEEILADNFALLMLGSPKVGLPKVDSPEVIDRMKTILNH